MTNKKLPLLFAACLCVCALFPPPARAQEAFDFDNIDSLLEENVLTDVSNRYLSVLQTYQPERAARLGYTSAALRLNDRTPAAQGHLLRALKSVREQLKEVNVKNLSEAKQADFELLQNALETDIRRAAQNRPAQDPLYYTEALDAVYDVYLSDTLSPASKRAALTARMAELAKTADQAETNLNAPSAFLAQLAMEKAYYAYLSFDELTEFLQKSAQDDVSAAQVKQNGQAAKRSVKRMFDLFKKLSKEESNTDFRLGEEQYAALLAQDYQINETPGKLIKKLEANTLEARKNLSAALAPFFEQLETEEVMLVEEADAQTAPQKTKPAKKKNKKGQLVMRNAQDFYAAATRTATAENADNYANLLQNRAAALEERLVQAGALPAGKTAVSVRAMPAFYAYTRAFEFRPSYTGMNGGVPEFFLRMPAGNRLARQEQLKKDFNAPTLKLMLSGQLLPGAYYQNAANKNWSVWRRMYPSAATANGWKEYAKRLAKEHHYIVADDELAFYAWDEYLRALAAETDAKLQTKRFSYADALAYLTQENGLEQAEAEEMIKASAANPGKAASRQYGLEVWQNAREKFRKKQGKKFNEADFHQKALQTGNVTPDKVEKEISRLYEKDKKKKKDLF